MNVIFKLSKTAEDIAILEQAKEIALGKIDEKIAEFEESGADKKLSDEDKKMLEALVRIRSDLLREI